MSFVPKLRMTRLLRMHQRSKCGPDGVCPLCPPVFQVLTRHYSARSSRIVFACLMSREDGDCDCGAEVLEVMRFLLHPPTAPVCAPAAASSTPTFVVPSRCCLKSWGYRTSTLMKRAWRVSGSTSRRCWVSLFAGSTSSALIDW